MSAGALLTLLLALVALTNASPVLARTAAVPPAHEVEVLTLEVAAERASAFAPVVRQAREALREAELAAAEAGLKLSPDAALSGSAGVNQSGPRASTEIALGGAISPRFSWSLSVESALPSSDPEYSASLRYALWPSPGPGAWGEAEKAQAQLERARALLATAEASAAATATRAFERLQIAEVRFALAEEALREADRALQTAQARRRQGSEVEALRAEIRFLEAQAERSERERAVKELRRALAELIGLEGERLNLTPFAGTPLLQLELPEREAALEAALATSVEVADRMRELEAARAELERVRSQNGVTLGLSASSGKEEKRDPTWGVFLNAQYDFGARQALVLAQERAQRAVEQAERNLEEAKKAVASRVEEAFATLETDVRTIELRERSERLRELEASVAREQHRRGLITDAALAAAERSLVAAQLDRAEAVSAYREHWAQLLLLTGKVGPTSRLRPHPPAPGS